MGNDNIYKMIVAMAEEIASWRKDYDLEWGEYKNDNDYKAEDIVNEYMKDYNVK